VHWKWITWGDNFVGKFKKGYLISPALCCLLGIGGCAMIGPDYIRPDVPEQSEWIEISNQKIKTEEADYSSWWSVFNDPVLDVLVEKVRNDNLDLHIAGVRILEARARLGIAIGGIYPQNQQARGGYSYTRASENMANTLGADLRYSELEIGFDAAWELDIWGKFRRAVESEIRTLEAAYAGYEDILVLLTAEMARAYFLLRTTEERLNIARENVKIQKRSLEITEARFHGGAVSELDVTQARSLLAGTQASIPRLESDRRQLKNAIAFLMGTVPKAVDDFLDTPGKIPTVPEEMAAGVPAEMLRRRPDIRLAEHQLAAQSARIGLARADLYPHFTLFGSIGFRSSDGKNTKAGGSSGSNLGDLFHSESLEFIGGPAFSWDIFNYGRITNRVRVEDARFQQLALSYENTVLRALSEVEDAMAAYLRSQEEAVFTLESVQATQRSVDLSMLQYHEGLVDYQRVLDALRTHANQQDSLISVKGSIGINLIALYKALGGGWEVRAGKNIIPENLLEQMRKRTNWDNMLEPENLQPTNLKPMQMRRR
jgi:NodT family efflux transporter outer membrane factor (OMF) lipoprotein